MCELTDALVNWKTMDRFVMNTKNSENTILLLLQMEKVGKKRLSFLRRIHSRYSVLRNNREIYEITRTVTFDYLAFGGDK